MIVLKALLHVLLVSIINQSTVLLKLCCRGKSLPGIGQQPTYIMYVHVRTLLLHVSPSFQECDCQREGRMDFGSPEFDV